MLATACGRAAPLPSSWKAQLGQLSPLRVLERGYAIVQNEAGEIVKHPEQAPASAACIRAQLAYGNIDGTVV